jgi:hypothetical protein
MCRGLPHYNIRGAQPAHFQITFQNMYMHAFLNIHMHPIIIHTSIFITRTLRTHLLVLLQTK